MKGRRFSTGHSDRSDPSSPSEVRAPISSRKPSSGYHGESQSYLDTATSTASPPSSDFRVGEAVRKTSPRVAMKNSTSLPNFSSGKDSGFDEAPVVEDVSNTVTRGSRGSGGAFIVSGVFNDSSRMFIPAPPSPTPDYDDDGDSDGNESDILQSSQFYVVSSPQTFPTKKPLGTRDSLSDDSLQSAPVIPSKVKKFPEASQNPLQSMMKEFHKGLPPPDQENAFSDDSLEESTTSPSGPSSISHRKYLQNSLESLISMESSTASFDYMNEGQARNASYGNPSLRPAPSVPKIPNNKTNNSSKDRKDINGKVKKSFSLNENAENRIDSVQSTRLNTKNQRESLSNAKGSKVERAGKFETIRTMLKEGLLEGLDERPPEFKPPPPSKKSPTSDRTDSGLSSLFSTTKSIESGRNNNHSDILSTAPAQDMNSSNFIDHEFGKSETLHSQSSITHERNRDDGDEVEVLMDDKIEIPSPPPKTDSVHRLPKANPSRENARASLRDANHSVSSPQRDFQSRPSFRSVPPTPSSSKNTSWLHRTANNEHNEMVEVSSIYSHCGTGDRVTHVDDLYGQNEQLGSGSEVSSAINGSLASHYSIQDSDNPLTDREFLENMKNMELRHRPDNLAIMEDQGSVASKENRSGRLFSRVADTLRSGSRTPTPNSSMSAKARGSNTKLTSTSRSSTRIHGDIIREPWKSSLSDSALLTQDYDQHLSYSPSVLPIVFDGPGRFRSNDNLAEAISEPYQQDFDVGKREKHSTLPSNLNSGDTRKESKELRRATSLVVGKKESSDGSKFRFNFFRGFWRRKQYSFDNKM
ncbi:hypothetical protein SK128_001717 [Halocaridina rubra]|uniref:Uncharacterized protein n=1 Tax=Halocaridina rubra TaxID=373956 RepID=A0AAN8X774_HALRR